MAEIASWNGHSFTVSPKLIRGFTGLTIKGSSETEDKTSDGQKYVSRKNSNPSEITLTAELNALTGCDVKNEALKFVDEARSGAKNYFYMGGKKLITCHGGICERNDDCPQWHMDKLQGKADNEAVCKVRRDIQFLIVQQFQRLVRQQKEQHQEYIHHDQENDGIHRRKRCKQGGQHCQDCGDGG